MICYRSSRAADRANCWIATDLCSG